MCKENCDSACGRDIGRAHREVNPLLTLGEDGEIQLVTVEGSPREVKTFPFRTCAPETIYVPVDVPLRTSGVWVNERETACEIGARLGRQIVGDGFSEDAYRKLLAATGSGSVRLLLQLIERVGLHNWVDGRFVVLPLDDAKSLDAECDNAGIHPSNTDVLTRAIESAEAKCSPGK